MEKYQDLFDHMSAQHDLILLTSEMDEIVDICARVITKDFIEVVVDAIAEEEEETPKPKSGFAKRLEDAIAEQKHLRAR